MTLTVLVGQGHPALGVAIAARLERPLGISDTRTFPDGELHVTLAESVRGHDVYVLQPIAPPAIERNLIELLLLADAARRAGAARITAVVSYLAYARQDRRANGREAAAARVIAELIDTRHFARCVAVHLHSAALEGFFSTPIEHLSAVPVLANAVRAHLPEHAVVVAPDLGAAKLAERYGKVLGLPAAVVHKERRGGTDVTVRTITGEVRGRVPIIVDDMLTTGATVTAAAKALVAAGCEAGPVVVATHALFAGAAVESLRGVHARRVIVTDSVPQAEAAGAPVEVASVASLLADAISRLHTDRSLQDLLAHE